MLMVVLYRHNGVAQSSSLLLDIAYDFALRQLFGGSEPSHVLVMGFRCVGVVLMDRARVTSSVLIFFSFFCVCGIHFVQCLSPHRVASAAWSLRWALWTAD